MTCAAPKAAHFSSSRSARRTHLLEITPSGPQGAAETARWHPRAPVIQKIGLSWDPFEYFVDDHIAEHAGSAAAFMEDVSHRFSAAAHIGLQVAQLHPGLNILISGVKLASGQYTLEEVLIDFTAGYIGGKVLTHAVGAFHKYKAIRRSDRVLRGVSDMYEHVSKMGTYKEMRRLTRGYNHDIQAHHILEVRHARRMGIKNTDDIPAVVLTREEYAMITRLLQRQLKTKVHHDKQTIRRVYQDVYKHRPEWLAAIEKYFQ